MFAVCDVLRRLTDGMVVEERDEDGSGEVLLSSRRDGNLTRVEVRTDMLQSVLSAEELRMFAVSTPPPLAPLDSDVY